VDMAARAARAQSGLRDSSYAIRFKRSGLSGRRDKASRCVLSRLHFAAIGLRTRRPRPKPSPASQFMLKAGPKINRSQHLVVGTEQIAPGASIPTHKHPTEDEIVLIHSGTTHAWVGEQERDLHAGGLVFIPANTWVGLKNTSAEPLDVTFIFSAPGFDEFQMCISVPAGESPTPMTEQDLRRCEAPGHMIYKEAAAEQQ
jgi:quercetin dioxygenase-like cupin family protein